MGNSSEESFNIVLDRTDINGSDANSDIILDGTDGGSMVSHYLLTQLLKQMTHTELTMTDYFREDTFGASEKSIQRLFISEVDFTFRFTHC